MDRYIIVFKPQKCPSLSGFDFVGSEQVKTAVSLEQAANFVCELAAAYHVPPSCFVIYDTLEE